MNWFFKKQIEKISFEDVQKALIDSRFYLINTLDIHEQDCLIKSTICANDEEKTINDMLENINVPDRKIIVYGKNTNDNKVDLKVEQLLLLGINELYIYPGGLFEWMLLQDIYGDEMFPTTIKVLDMLKFSPNRIFI
jgi:rhodanese-related sulfurtransferase